MKLFLTMCIPFWLCMVGENENAMALTTTLQPAPGINDGSDDGSADRGKDAGTWGNVDDRLYLFNSPCNVEARPGYIQFSMTGMPTSAVVKAELAVYASVGFNGAGWPWPVSPIISARQLTSAWIEYTGDVVSRPSAAPTPLDSKLVSTVGGGSSGFPYMEFEGWLTFDITQAYTNWADDTETNYGLELAIDTTYCQNGDFFLVYTSDETNAPAFRPKLVVYTSPPAPTVISGLFSSPTGIQIVISNIEPRSTNYIWRSTDLLSGMWTNVSMFVGASAITNWTDNVTATSAFYQILSE